ncbi:hypothetical protein EHS25_001116 [Saitozyma podzolica]|uniref:Uncharacterized protein n=1 Tax=Saitozyma podzolica TaxID=1890683 RepID=A0A427YH92_9TREE|nr:hypothetical protein EHS25_001116 [Saitozyma podzolica]
MAEIRVDDVTSLTAWARDGAALLGIVLGSRAMLRTFHALSSIPPVTKTELAAIQFRAPQHSVGPAPFPSDNDDHLDLDLDLDTESLPQSQSHSQSQSQPPTRPARWTLPLPVPTFTLRRPVSRYVLAKLTAGCFSLSIGLLQLFSMFVMPHITSQLVIDCIWGTVIFLACWHVFWNAIVCVAPFPSTIHLGRPDALSPVGRIQTNLIPFPHAHHLRLVVAALLSVATLWTTAAGYTFLHPFVAGAIALRVATIQPKEKVTMFAAAGGLLAVEAMIGVIAGVCYLIWGADEPKPDDPKKTLPSDYIRALLFVFLSLLPHLMVATLLSLTYRADFSRHTQSQSHSRSIPRLLPLGPSATDRFAVPTSLPSFPAPTFSAGLISSGISVIILRILPSFLDVDPAACALLGVFGSMPFVIFSMGGTAWVTGHGKAWLAYEEDWRIRVLSDDEGELEDVEKAIRSESESESDRTDRVAAHESEQ